MATNRISLNIKSGNRVEILTNDNRLERLCKVYAYTGDVITLQDAKGQELPPALYNRDVKMRLTQSGVNCIILGKVCGSTKHLWKIDRLQTTAVSEKREYFRQPLRAPAKVQCLKRSEQSPKLSRGVNPSACEVLDVSAGGVMIRSAEPFQQGDLLLVTDAQIGDEKPFRFTCYVQRVNKMEGRESQFGCQFESMDRREEDRLLRAIFSIQRKEIQKSRG